MSSSRGAGEGPTAPPAAALRERTRIHQVCCVAIPFAFAIAGSALVIFVSTRSTGTQLASVFVMLIGAIAIVAFSVIWIRAGSRHISSDGPRGVHAPTVVPGSAALAATGIDPYRGAAAIERVAERGTCTWCRADIELFGDEDASCRGCDARVSGVLARALRARIESERDEGEREAAARGRSVTIYYWIALSLALITTVVSFGYTDWSSRADKSLTSLLSLCVFCVAALVTLILVVARPVQRADKTAPSGR